ncbi:MAG: hypothetical protein ABIU18_02000 [Novosphingobium sp.]
MAGFPPIQPELLSTPDWHGLKTRFLAAHALRREMELQNAAAVAGGSFTSESAQVLASRRENSRGVNPNASANGKTPHAIETDIADPPYPASEE